MKCWKRVSNRPGQWIRAAAGSTCSRLDTASPFAAVRRREWPHRDSGRLVVDLISDSATIEFTSWIPGTFDSFSKKNRS
ncbi:hypothetical protein D3C81_2048940 [compost metagenome]